MPTLQAKKHCCVWLINNSFFEGKTSKYFNPNYINNKNVWFLLIVRWQNVIHKFNLSKWITTSYILYLIYPIPYITYTLYILYPMHSIPYTIFLYPCLFQASYYHFLNIPSHLLINSVPMDTNTRFLTIPIWYDIYTTAQVFVR